MDLRRLRLFLAVVDQDGFTAASRAEHVSQPAVSLAVRELEAELGAPLLVRSRGGVTLTAAGEALVPHARRSLRSVEHAVVAVGEVTGLVAGHLDLTTLPTLAADPVADLVGRFRLAHAAVSVHLSAPNSLDELADDVRSGSAEVGITEQGPANDGLAELHLYDQELLAVSPPGQPSAEVRIDRLQGTPLVLTPRGSSLRDTVAIALAAADVVPDVAVETAQRDALIPLVLAGAGTTFLPTQLAEQARQLGAVVRRTTPRLRRTIVLVHRRDALGPAGRRFIELAVG